MITAASIPKGSEKNKVESSIARMKTPTGEANVERARAENDRVIARAISCSVLCMSRASGRIPGPVQPIC